MAVRRRDVRRPLTLAFALAAVAMVTAACVSLPDTGPVQTTEDRPPAQTGADSEFRPRGPVPGDPAVSTVGKFLNAMTATPVATEPARAFFTAEAKASWQPTRVFTYVQKRTELVGDDEVRVELTGARWVDQRGQWRGRLGDGQRTLRFGMTQENGQWRIAKAPDALVVPIDWFLERGFRAASTYYLDPSARILVPEPVFVPRGDQLATVLVQALLAGPGPRLDDVARTFVPTGLRPGLSVPVSNDGIASVTLEGDSTQITPQTAKLMVYQFAWTLKQDPSVSTFRITVGDQPLTLDNGGSQFSVDLGSEYDPIDVQSSSQLFAVVDGFLETGNAQTTDPVGGPFGGPDPYGIVDVAVSLKADQAAVVADAGTTLLRGPVSQDGSVGTQIAGATDLLRPSWDFADRLWVVDRASDGARVSMIDVRDGIPRLVDVPGISGEDVRQLQVSRDGSRLVAVVRGTRDDALRLSRIRYDNQGGLLGATRARPLAWNPGDVRRIRDIGWRSTTSVAVLHQFTPDVVQISSVPVDGSPIRESPISQLARARRLVTSPVPNEALFTLTAQGDLADPTGTAGDSLLTGAAAVHYAG